MTDAKLVILRHGQTDYNAKHLMTGQRDIPLNKTGEAQARQAGGLVRDIRFDKVYSSTLSRAFNTAALVLESSGTQKHLQDGDSGFRIERRAEIIEMDNGDYTGRCKDDPDVAALILKSDHVPWPGGESVDDVVARVRKFYEAELLPRLEKGENVMVVAHNVVLRAFEIVLGAETPGVKRKIPNAAPAVFEYADGALKRFYYPEAPQTPANQDAKPAQKRKNGQGPAI
ncbi:MAG: histidine phosphatase family protein [Alphaproteobacteria bacterium]|nr:histidine phosphatase family protein [Alphaproteobacteria bacterium]